MKMRKRSALFPRNSHSSAEWLNGIITMVAMLALVFGVAGGGQRGDDEMENSTPFLNNLQLLFEYREQLRHVHPFLNDLYPVALVENDRFHVFDLDEAGEKYVFIVDAPTGMAVPKGVRAAFPLDFYDNKPACVVTADVFDSLEGIITIFHEFIHCRQWNTVEPGLRKTLPLANKKMEERDFMWEINYPFPYDDEDFEKTYTAWIQTLDNMDNDSIEAVRKRLKKILDPFDYQYMVWQEWKEGFALYVENKIREHFDIGKNTVGRRPPYNRTAFYAGGAGYINYLVVNRPELSTDLEALFFEMLGQLENGAAEDDIF